MLSPDLLQHLLDLSAKTGDRLIIVNPTSAQTFVLMSLKDYEAIAVPAQVPSPLRPARRVPDATEPNGMPVGGRDGGRVEGEGNTRWSPLERAATLSRSRVDSKSIDRVNAELAAAEEPTAEPIIEVMAPPPAPMISDEEGQKFYFEPV